MILPCIRENDTDPVNKIEDFVTVLPEEFDLKDDWELGLTEITYPRMWCTLPYDQKIEILKFQNDDHYINCIFNEDDHPKSQYIVKKGDYTLDELIIECNKVISSMFVKDSEGIWRINHRNENEVTIFPYLYIDTENDKKIRMRIGCLDNKQRFFLRFGEQLGNILGFGYHETTHLADTLFYEYKELLELNKEHVFKECDQNNHKYEYGFRDFNIDRNVNYMYITCDAIKESYFEDIKSDLLRVIRIPENSYFGQQITEIFDYPYYFPLKSNKFEKIRIKIYQNLPEKSKHDLLPFTYGRILVHLHLRKCEKIVRPNLEPETEPKLRPETSTEDSKHEVEGRVEEDSEPENPNRNKTEDESNKETPIITDEDGAKENPDNSKKIDELPKETVVKPAEVIPREADDETSGKEGLIPGEIINEDELAKKPVVADALNQDGIPNKEIKPIEPKVNPVGWPYNYHDWLKKNVPGGEFIN